MLKDKLYSTSSPLIMDGAIGSYLQNLKELHSDKSECNSFLISLLHQNYIEAGAQIIKTNTFNLGNIALKKGTSTIDLKTQIVQNIQIASLAKANYQGVLIFGVVGPLFYGDRAQRISTYEVIVNTFIENGIENLYLETITSNSILREIIEALQSIKSKDRLSINLSFTTKEDVPMKLISGDSLEGTVELIKEMEQIDTVGINCISTERVETIKQNLIFLQENLHSPLSFSPSLGIPNGDGFYPLSIKQTIYNIAKLTSEIDLKIIGGCCGTQPFFIKQLNTTHNLNKNSDLYL